MSSIRNAVRSVVSSPGPTVAVEIEKDGVTAIALAVQSGRVRVEHTYEPLPPGAVVPAVAAANVVDRAAVVGAVRSVLSRVARGRAAIGLVVPDSAAKVSVLRFDAVPRRSADLNELVRWQLRRSAPFRMEDAQVAHTPGRPVGDSGRELVVVMMRRDIVEEYEGVCVEAGARPGLVDLASLNLVNAAVTTADAPTVDDWALVHIAAGYQTIAIVRGSDLIFFRNHAVDGGRTAGLADLVHQSAMYYEDRLEGSRLSRTFVVDRSEEDDPGGHQVVVAMLADRLASPVDHMTTGDRISVNGAVACGAPEWGAALGLLLRDRLVTA